MVWCFRLRFRLSDFRALGRDDREWVLLNAPPQRVVLLPGDEQETLATARIQVLHGSGYDTQVHANEAGQQWRDWLTLALASITTGVDFGDRAPRGALTEEALKLQEGVRVLNDVHGLMTFECDPPPVFVTVTATTMRPMASRELEEALTRVRAVPREVSTSQRLAYDLFSAAQSETNADARFMMLMMALETLIKQRSASSLTKEIVSKFIEAVGSSDLPEKEKESLKGSLRDLKKRESVGQAGRRLVAGVGDHLNPLLSADPEAFFKKCYALRSKLVHGEDPRPSRDDVAERAAGLEVFVSHLISEPFPVTA